MARLEIDFPEQALFVARIPIRIGDINYGGHLGNEAVLALAQEARVQFLVAHGWSELDIEGTSLLMIDAALVYTAMGLYGMHLRVELGLAEARTRGCDLVYRMSDEATGHEIARVRTGLVFRDRSTGKLVRMPEALKQVLAPAGRLTR